MPLNRSTSSRTLFRVVPAAILLSLTAMSYAAGNPCPVDGPQSQATCMREMAAAKQAARTGGLSNPGEATLERNALARCDVFKTPEGRSDCEARVRNRRASGSVGGGGELLEATTPARQ